ncbi:MAG: methyltransferase domain-containing protein [Desulfobacteraceae bacterium]|nr:methyltransferase domain-containing protein [Desulfobacteraceae bacterium]
MITINFKHIPISLGMKVLDIGCGSGRHTAAAYGLPGALAVGIDTNPGDIAEAGNRLMIHERLGEHGGGRWGFAGADAAHLPFRRHAFDLVLLSEVLEHIPDISAVVRESLRVLKPGNFLAVSVPRYLPEKICWSISRQYSRQSGGHVRIFRKRQVVALFRSKGLQLQKIHYTHSLHTPYWWLKCIVGLDRERFPVVDLYHRFLVWDIMKAPLITRFISRLIDPLLGKSMVFYFKKPILPEPMA